ncbi:MAG: hypothetical protein VX438_06485, partial [Planctomycetota bacterium]|nr:hypothetical protein [Planctomycetota bacterium]
FYYPANWTLFVNDGDEHSGEEETNEVTLQSPNSAQLTIAIYELFQDSEELLARTLDALKSEYEDLEVEPASNQIGELELKGYDVTFFYLDLLVVAELRLVEREHDKVLLLLQSESRELDETRDVFSAIIVSLLSPEVAEEG